MKSILPILAGLMALALATVGQAQGTPAVGPSPGGTPPAAGDESGNRLFERVVAGVDRAPSIAAKLRHRVDLLDRPLLGTGTYLQQGRGEGRMFRLELELRTSLYATNVLHVCNGQHLWMLEEFDGHTSLSRVDVHRLRGARSKSEAAPPSAEAWMALGGLPKLLASLQQSFHFERVTAGSLDDLPVWSIEGTWQPARLAQWLPEQQESIEAGAAVDLAQLTPNLPHRVVVHVGGDDLFPYRIEYWRSERTKKATDAPSREKLIVVMELFEVRIGAPVDHLEFVYRPPADLSPSDRTKEFLDRFGLEDPLPAEAKRRSRLR